MKRPALSDTARLVPRYGILIVICSYLLVLLAIQTRDLIAFHTGRGFTSDLYTATRTLWGVRRTGGYLIGKGWRTDLMYAAGMQDGDRITAVNGILLREHPEALQKAHLYLVPGDSIRYTWLRQGQTMSGVGRVPPPSGGTGRFQCQRDDIWVEVRPELYFLTAFLKLGFVPLLFLAVGGAIGFARARDRTAFHMALICLAVGVTIFANVGAFLADKPIALLTTLALLGPAITVLLLLLLWVVAVFPASTGLGRWFVRHSRPLAIFLAVIGVTSVLGEAGTVIAPEVSWVKTYQTALQKGELIAWLLGGVLIALVVALLVAQRVESRRHPERRLAVLEAGLVSALVWCIWGSFNPINAVWKATHPTTPFAQQGLFLLNEFLPVILVAVLPVSIAYAVLARRLFDIRFFIRKGLQYLLLSRTMIAVEGLALFLIVFSIVRASVPQASHSDPALAGIAALSSLGFVLGFSQVNRRLMEPIDRRFFRERYDARRTLLELGDRLTILRDPGEITRKVGGAIDAALHPARLGFVDVEEGGSEAGAITTVLAKAGEDSRWVDLPAPEVNAAKDQAGEPPYELLIPVRSSKGWIGCVALAGKRSEEPYSREDKELLRAVATQMGLALENARLLDIARREAEQAKELGIARDIQESLFPRALPQVPSWDFAAACRPAREVGGDYYDLFDAGDGRVVLALGDVAGKGLGPALVMASVRSMIRSRLRSGTPDLVKLFEEINADLCESTPGNIFITLFVAVLDTTSGTLRYSNGGHPPPLLLAADPERCERLETGGPIVGLLPGIGFEEGRSQIEPGGSFVLYSDGLSEALDEGGAMYEDERVGLEVAELRCRSAPEVLAHLFESVDRFRGRAEQSDDISILVVRRLPSL